MNLIVSFPSDARTEKTNTDLFFSCVGGLFGTAIALSGDHLFVGAPTNSEFGDFSGTVQQFVFEAGSGAEPDSWNWVQNYPSPTQEFSANFGYQLALSDRTLLAASPNTGDYVSDNVSRPLSTGQVYVFEEAIQAIPEPGGLSAFSALFALGLLARRERMRQR